MKIFVTGATGYLGSGVLRAIQRAGHRAVGLCRSREKAEALRVPGAEWIQGDLRDPASYRDAASGCEGIVHTAADYGPERVELDRATIDALVATARAGGSRRVLVYTSGVWVLGSTGDRAVDESTPPDHPAAAVTWRPALELAVLDAAGGTLSTAVVRPGNVYGGRGGSFGAMFAAATAGEPPAVVGDGANRWTTIHVDDMADLYLRILERAWGDEFQKLPGRERLFHAVDGSSDSLREIGRAASLAAGGDGSVRFQPIEEARGEMGSVADALAMDQVAAAPRSERVLAWRPRWRGFVGNAGEIYREWARGS